MQLVQDLPEGYLHFRSGGDASPSLAEAHQRWRRAVQPDVDAAILDGTLADAVDPQSVLFLTRILRLGLLLHRRSGLPDPDPDSWEHLMQLVVASFGPPRD